MISTFSAIKTLRNITNQILVVSIRNKSTDVCTSSEQTINVESNSDMPTITTNPFKKEKKLCVLCQYNLEPDYKNVRLLSQFQSRYTGRIYGKHITGLCDYKQKRIEQEILKAQSAGLMGCMTKEPKYANDPKLFDPSFPFKPHPY